MFYTSSGNIIDRNNTVISTIDYRIDWINKSTLKDGICIVSIADSREIRYMDRNGTLLWMDGTRPPKSSAANEDTGDSYAKAENQESLPIPEATNSASNENLLGTWECLIENSPVETFIYRVGFTESNVASYMAGWYESDVAVSYEGKYTVEAEDSLSMSLTLDYAIDDSSPESVDAQFSYDISNNLLTLTKESGSDSVYPFRTGEAMVFNKVE